LRVSFKEKSRTAFFSLSVGRLGRGPEMRYLPTGQPVTSFSVATNRHYTAKNGERIQKTVWFQVSAWGRLAENCNQYLQRGSKVLVEGRLNHDPETGGPRTWTRKDGSTAASFEITAASVQFLSGRAEVEDSPDAAGDPIGSFQDEEVPF